jgi:gamma-glutamylcyclotransferase (GGCT)/AIG2-like uncharacterized protein YtfP
MMPSRHTLFCYGTLCDPHIMRQVSRYTGPGERASLAGYERVSLYGLAYPAILPREDYVTDGVLYHALTLRQLEKIDRYEQRQYVRSRVWVRTGQRGLLQAWTYVLHPRYYRRILRRPWSFNTFQSRHRASYLSGLCGLHK